MSIKIAFSGIGGVGGYYGGMLAKHGEQNKDINVYFISRGENLELIRKQGLEIKLPHSSQIVHPQLATDKPAEIGPVDYLFCTTKNYDLEDNIRQLAPLIDSKTVIIPLLNGVDVVDRIRDLLPQQEVWYACVYIGARLTAPGLVSLFTERERLWFGSSNPNSDRKQQEQLLNLLLAAGIGAENPEDIVLRIWQKFFLISLSATITSYYDQSIGEVLEYHSEDYYLLGAELKAIAVAKGICLPTDICEQVLVAQRKMPYKETTSMHTDFKKGNRTELETLTGYVVKSGKDLGLSVANYEKMYAKLKSIS